MSDGTSISGGRWLRTSYPERDTESPHLIPETDLTDVKDREGLDNGG
jgi:hypothetical protein